MKTTLFYENYPPGTVILSSLVSLINYGSGLYIMYQLGYIPAALYLAFILFLEYRLLGKHCVDCWYWGRVCGFGKGRISSLFFKKGDGSKFCKEEMSWKEMIPDLMVFLVPAASAVILLIIRFELVILAVLALLITMSTAGNGYIRGKLTCRFCRQREIGCPAEKLFGKKSEI